MAIADLKLRKCDLCKTEPATIFEARGVFNPDEDDWGLEEAQLMGWFCKRCSKPGKLQ